MRIITLLTDFGVADPFVGIMKGVIFTINARVRVVDLCHEISPQDVHQAAFLLHCSYRYFPKRTIHVIVIDPGVGGSRRSLLAEGGHGYYLAPDNGVLSYLFASGEIRRVVEITADAYFLHPVSQTFHGRDIFAPVAAHLSRGRSVGRFGKETSTYTRLTLPVPRKTGSKLLVGSILHVDHFGNLITNISPKDIAALHPERSIEISIAGRKIQGLERSYDSLRTGKVGAIVGSAGYLEIFATRRSAARLLKVGPGTPVRVEGVEEKRKRVTRYRRSDRINVEAK